MRCGRQATKAAKCFSTERDYVLSIPWTVFLLRIGDRRGRFNRGGEKFSMESNVHFTLPFKNSFQTYEVFFDSNHYLNNPQNLPAQSSLRGNLDVDASLRFKQNPLCRFQTWFRAISRFDSWFVFRGTALDGKKEKLSRPIFIL